MTHTPTIHPNGTSADGLTSPLCDLYAALGEAYEKTRQCNPNMRDYYPALDAHKRYDLAVLRIRGWQKQIEAIRAEIEADIAAIEKQEPLR